MLSSNGMGVRSFARGGIARLNNSPFEPSVPLGGVVIGLPVCNPVVGDSVVVIDNKLSSASGVNVSFCPDSGDELALFDVWLCNWIAKLLRKFSASTR